MAGSIGKIYRDRGDRWRIVLPGGIKIFCDRNHRTLYSRQHAEWALARIQGEIENGTFDPDFYSKTRKSLHSFTTYAEDWLRSYERKMERGDISRGYLGQLRRCVNDVFIPYFGEMSLQDIRGKHIREFYLTLEKAPKTVYNNMMILHKVFASAYDDELIQSPPKFPKELKASEIPEPDWKWANEEIQDLVLKELAPEDFFFIFFQVTHGTRTGETRALQHQDIDLDSDVVTIRRAFSENDLRHTKTKRIRRIPLDPIWKELYLSRPRNINPEAFVFTKDGKPISRTWPWRKWTEACKNAGVSAINLYEGTRHSFASQAANRGVSLYVISKFLGHSTMAMTARYSHLDTKPLRQAQRQAAVINIDSAKCQQLEKRFRN
ncbi:MAG: site-specific integrase [Deltaproteobacteria bacterium]|nr:site-specific integrase [Deltaproteobacteria bacterium]